MLPVWPDIFWSFDVHTMDGVQDVVEEVFEFRFLVHG